MSPYTDLEARFHRLQALRNALGVLHWDMATMMPAGGAEARAEQLAALNVVCHGMLADPVMGDLLDRGRGRRAPISTSGSTPISRRCAGNGSMPRRSSRAGGGAVQGLLGLRAGLARGAAGGRFRHGEAGAGRAAGAWCARRRRPRRRARASAPMTRCSTNTSPAAARPRSTSCSTISPPSCRDSGRAVLERQARRPAPLEPAGPFPIEKQRDARRAS